MPFMGWGERLGICELENAPKLQKCTKTFVHDCRFNVPKIDIVLTDVIVMWLFLILDAAPAKKSRKKKRAGPLSRPIICICNDQWVQELLGHDSYGHDYFLQIRNWELYSALWCNLIVFKVAQTYLFAWRLCFWFVFFSRKYLTNFYDF